MSSRPSRIVELATLIATSTAKIDEYLRLHNHPQPSFDVDAPAQVLPDETPEIEDARTTAVEASIELQELLQGAESLLCPFVSATRELCEVCCRKVNDILCMDIVKYVQFASHLSVQDSFEIPNPRRDIVC